MASSSNFITYIPQKNLKITDNYLDNQRYVDNPNLNLFVQIEEDGYAYNTSKGNFGNQTDGEEGFPFEYYPSKNGLIPWGWIEGGDFLFYWLPEEDKWSIVVYDDAATYKKFDMTISEFIYNLMKGEVEFSDLEDLMPENKSIFEKY